MAVMRNGAALLRDVLLACLIVGVVFTMLLANSIEHKESGPPISSGNAAMRAMLRQRSLSEHSTMRAKGSKAAPGPGPAPRIAGNGLLAEEWPPRFEVYISPSPSSMPEVEQHFDTRNCVCEVDGKTYKGRVTGMPALGRAPAKCKCNDGECPADVNLGYLTEAVGQDVCSLRRNTGYGCTAGCFGPDKPVSWYGFSCGGAGQNACPDLVATPSPSSTPSPTTPPPIEVPVVTWDPAAVVDLRGLQCEIGEDGVEKCFMEDTQGRTLCPAFVTSAYLRDPPVTGPHAIDLDTYTRCGAAYAKSYYCTAHCQPGNDRVQWWTHDISWCYSREGAWACPSMHPVAPKAQFTVKPWSEPSAEPKACHRAHAAGIVPPVVENLTVGLLTHEPKAFTLSMKTYDELGFFSVVPEFLIYMNNRRPELEAVLEPYQKKYPGLFRVLGNATNVGIARGMVELTNAAKYNNFLFMERDFWLVEPATCVVEQLRAGIALLDTGSVHVVRYRHRIKAGRPNWAENFFKGHEDDAFVGRQPNLACNVYYWVMDVEKRWPDKFLECGKNPQMLCSDSYYCNWTNNPQLWRVDWWNKEYVSQFDKFRRNDPWYDLESYMNWEPNSWNDRQFTVAQGDGLFMHVDPTKW